MTLFLPLEGCDQPQSLPTFVASVAEPDEAIGKVIKAILKAKRIVVVCGAGISVQAGIPDFRSSEGLFTSLKRDNPKEGLNSGKDLFDASVFNSEQSTTLFCQMISKLSKLSDSAQPTAFHHLLRALDQAGKLLRVYTQNIDALEIKSGLSFGMDEGAAGSDARCIPLHGTLRTMHCQFCTKSFPLADHLPGLSLGALPECPECTSTATARQLSGKRVRGIGKLRPSVVLYNEAHKDGENVGQVVQKDLIGTSKRSGADLLLVVGTSLRVTGTKRMVREFSKAVHSRSSKDSPSSTPRPEDGPKAIYLNLDFPLPTREWEGVFDVWLQGDAQTFAATAQLALDKSMLAKEKKRKSAASSSPSKRPKIITPPSTPEKTSVSYHYYEDDRQPDMLERTARGKILPEVVIPLPSDWAPPTPNQTPPHRQRPALKKVVGPYIGLTLPPSSPVTRSAYSTMMDLDFDSLLVEEEQRLQISFVRTQA